MIDNFVILTNILLVVLVIGRSIMLDSRIGWFDPVNEQALDEDQSSKIGRRRTKTPAVETNRRRR